MYVGVGDMTKILYHDVNNFIVYHDVNIYKLWEIKYISLLLKLQKWFSEE